MTRRDDMAELPDGWGPVSLVNRRDFLKLTGSGLLVMVALPGTQGFYGFIAAFMLAMQTGLVGGTDENG